MDPEPVVRYPSLSFGGGILTIEPSQTSSQKKDENQVGACKAKQHGKRGQRNLLRHLHTSSSFHWWKLTILVHFV